MTRRHTILLCLVAAALTMTTAAATTLTQDWVLNTTAATIALILISLTVGNIIMGRRGE